MTAQAEPGPVRLSESSDEIYIFGLLSTAASVFQLGGGLSGRRVILFVGDEAACAAMAKGTAKDKVALMLVYSLRAMVAQYEIALLWERTPPKLNPADLRPEKGRHPSRLSVARA